MTKLAVVTGGSAGIGAALADRLAADAYQLVLVARGEARLRERADALARTHGVAVEVLPADLATEAGVAAVAASLRERPVDLLVNSAGMALGRWFLKSTPEDEERLLRLNVHAVMRLTLAVLPGMVERRSGGVVNVSSIAGFAAGIPGSTYSASKAWVTNFSESMAYAVRRYGVRVMALCPGYVRTELHQRTGIDESTIPSWLWLDADRVAADALRSLARGKVVRVVDWRYRIAIAGLRLTPRGLVPRLTRNTRGRFSRR